jgi:hypothetical protein
MFIRKWGATEWAQLLAGLALLAGVLSTAPSAIAAPLQAPPVAKSCKDFPAINRTTINLAGVNNNDSCIAAWITGCDLHSFSLSLQRGHTRRPQEPQVESNHQAERHCQALQQDGQHHHVRLPASLRENLD